ncbi:MAG: hypothetical protein OEY89_18760 [Gammaproteobacteria bacterium]|nr:hypothetical protein [Gammaproteobacteria bacterium]
MNTSDQQLRSAISMQNRINEGYDIGTVVGMDIETALYRTDPALNIKIFIQALRDRFRFKDSGQNIINGRAFLEHIQSTSIEYPFEIDSLPAATERQKQTITEQLNKIYDRLNTTCELLLEESAKTGVNQTNFVDFVNKINVGHKAETIEETLTTES